MQPETRYAKSGEIHIAYQVVGDGPLDLVLFPGFVSHLEYRWEDPGYSRLLGRLASFSRLITFDKRGTGLSDRTAGLDTLEQRMDDARAVMDAVGSSRAALFGWSEGGPMCALFAATYPERTTALILLGAYARRAWAEDHPWGVPPEQAPRVLEIIEREWGGPVGLEIWAPSAAADDRFRRWWATYLRLSASPGAALAIMQMNLGIDARHILPAVRVPTLIMHRAGDRLTNVSQGRYLAEHIAGAKYVELPGEDHVPWVGDVDTIADEVEEFLTGVRHGAEPDRVLATVLFTDIVRSTERAAALGDRRWRDLLDAHHAAVRRELARFRGREVHTAGDGFLATFDGPARAIRCSGAIIAAVRPLGIEVRAGLHTGEIELMGDDIGGIAVHIAARVSGLAKPGEVLVTGTVKDLVAGSGTRFTDRGTHDLKGVEDAWRLFAVILP